MQGAEALPHSIPQRCPLPALQRWECSQLPLPIGCSTNLKLRIRDTSRTSEVSFIQYTEVILIGEQSKATYVYLVIWMRVMYSSVNRGCSPKIHPSALNGGLFAPQGTRVLRLWTSTLGWSASGWSVMDSWRSRDSTINWNWDVCEYKACTSLLNGQENKRLIPPGIEPGALSVLDSRDNHYTMESDVN